MLADSVLSAVFRIVSTFTVAAAISCMVCNAAWYQRSSDCGQTNHVNFTGKQFKTGWKYATKGGFYGNFAATANGTLYVTDQPSGGALGVTAVSSKGKVLWKSPVLGDFLSNILIDAASSSLLVAALSDSLSNSTLYNVNLQTGKIKWMQRYAEINTCTSLSMSNITKALYLADYTNQNILALNIKDGSVLWNKTGLQGVYEQQPTAMSCDGKTVFLPTDVNGGGSSKGKGTIIAYAADTGKILWKTATNFSISGNLACGGAAGGIVVGLVGGLGPGGDGIFAISVADGTLLWKMETLCKCVFYGGTSGPVVDTDGNSYFSCGNQMFSLDSKGSKRWVSPLFDKIRKNNTCGGALPSLHPKGYVFFVHSNKTMMYALSASSGSVAHMYGDGTNKTSLAYAPVLLGNKFMYVTMGFQTVASMKLNLT